MKRTRITENQINKLVNKVLLEYDGGNILQLGGEMDAMNYRFTRIMRILSEMQDMSRRGKNVSDMNQSLQLELNHLDEVLNDVRRKTKKIGFGNDDRPRPPFYY